MPRPHFSGSLCLIHFSFRSCHALRNYVGSQLGYIRLYQAIEDGNADKLIADGRLDKFVADRYASWNTGIGADIISGKATLADLEQYALSKGEVTASLSSGSQERLESILNNIMFSL